MFQHNSVSLLAEYLLSSPRVPTTATPEVPFVTLGELPWNWGKFELLPFHGWNFIVIWVAGVGVKLWKSSSQDHFCTKTNTWKRVQTL